MNFSSPIPALMAMQMRKSSFGDSRSKSNSEITEKVKKNCLDFNRPYIWVRSQSGISLSAVSSFGINTYYSENFIVDNNSYCVLGRYSDFKTAKNVLDCIQQFIVTSSNDNIFVMPEDKKENIKGGQND